MPSKWQADKRAHTVGFVIKECCPRIKRKDSIAVALTLALLQSKCQVNEITFQTMRHENNSR